MKNTKGYLAALAVAVLFGALQFAGSNVPSKSLQSNVPGYSIPVDTNYSSFGCKSPGSWSDTVWCQAYGSTYASHVTEANKHSGIIAIFKRTGTASGGFGIPNYGDYYVTGSYGSTAVGKNGQTYNAKSVVKCPGSTINQHQSSHHKYSPSLGEGFYDGDNHYWCEVSGVAVDPEKVDGRPAGVQLPDSEDISRDKLYPIFFPGGTVKYKKIDDAASFYKCSNGYEGPYEPGVNQYLNMYHIKESWKKPYYRCLTADGSGFENAVSDGSMASFTASTGATNISASMFGLNDVKNCSADYTTCQPSCAAGDSTCGGTGTYVMGGAFCASNAYIFQTTDYNTRYCAASLTTGTYTPPAPTFTLADPTSIVLDPTYHVAGKTTFQANEAIYFKAKRTINGTGIPSYPSVMMRIKISTTAGNFSAPIWTGETSGTTYADTHGVAVPANTLVTGTYYFCAEMAMNNDNSMVTNFNSASQKTACIPSGTSFILTATCSAGQTWNGTSCISSCPTGQNWDSVKNMCISSDWKEIIWNNLGLKSYVSINAPQSVIDAAKAACANTDPSKVTWPNPSDFTKPDTAGIPNCSGTPAPATCGNKVCESSETAISCPADCGSPTACDNDNVCENGESPASCPSDCKNPPNPILCNYDGICNADETTVTCPADCGYKPPSTCKLGQTDCDVSLSCDQGKRCYVGGNKLSCINWDASCSGNVCPPQGSSQYYSGCKEPGSITDRVGDDFPGNCEFSMSCYSKDEKKRYCQAMGTTMAPAFSPTCTNPEFPKACSPLDTSCLDIGESGTSGYCASGGKECYADGSTSFTCIAESEECKGSVCPTDPKDPRFNGCTAEGAGPENGWCAIRNSIQFFKQSAGGGIYCLKNPNPTDMYFWETATPPEGYGRCRYGEANNGCIDKLNVPVKKVSGKGYWCAVGMRQDDEANGIVTCVPGKDYKPPVIVDPPIEICQDVMSVAYNPSTLDCKTFSNSCLSEGWLPLGVNQACENGKVIELSKVTDDKALIEIIDKKLSFLDSIRYRLKELPVSLSETAVLRDLVDKAITALKDLRAKLPAKTAKARGDVSEELERVNKNILADIEDKWAKVQPYVDFATLRDEITGRLPDLKHEAGACDQSTDYCERLNEMVPILESLVVAAEGQTGQAFEQLVTDIKNTWDKLKKIMEEERTGHRDRFFETQVKKLLDDREKIRAFIKDHAIDNTKITYIFSEFDAIVTYLQNIVSTMEFDVIPVGTVDGIWTSPKQILERAFELKTRLEEYLMTYYDYEVVYVTSLEDLLPFIQDEVKKQLELLFPEIEQTIKVLMDEALQELALNMAQIVEELKPEIKEAISQGLSNLAIELNESRKAILDEVIAATNEIVKSLSDLERVVAEALGTFNANRYRTDVIEVVAPVVWCGDYAALVESQINNAGLAIENGESVNVDELHIFVTDAMADNILECRRVGASRFYMPIESWYWPYVEESAERGCISGYSEPSGEATGYFGEGNPTLRIEALKMVSCIFGVPQGAATTDRTDVPAWGVPYFNGLKDAGVEFDWSLPMDQVITRFEIAELVVKTMLALDKDNVVTEADKLGLVEDFSDAAQVSAHKYALAVETLVDLGVLNGHADGHFGGYELALRSEFAAILDRVNDLIVEMYGIHAEGEVAIGNPESD